MISVPVNLILQQHGRFVKKLMNIYVTISEKEAHFEAFDIGVTPPAGWLFIGCYDAVKQTFTAFQHDPATYKGAA